MARVPEVTREQLPEDKRQIFDEIMASRGRVGGPFSVLLHSPDSAAPIARLGHHIRFENALEPWVVELVVIAAAREWDCRFEWAAHAAAAERVGLGPEIVAAVRDRTAPKGFSAQQALLVNFVQELLRRHRVSQPTFYAAVAWLGVSGVAELTATIGYYSLLACALDAFEVEPPPGADVLPVN
jgi:4-carboxymuconolactone decarboxylase